MFYPKSQLFECKSRGIQLPYSNPYVFLLSIFCTPSTFISTSTFIREMRVHVSSKFKILEVSNRRCLQHRVSETILNLVNEANVEGYLSQSSLSTLFQQVLGVQIDKNYKKCKQNVLTRTTLGLLFHFFLNQQSDWLSKDASIKLPEEIFKQEYPNTFVKCIN